MSKLWGSLHDDEDVVSYSMYYRPEGETEYTKLAQVDNTVTTWTHNMRNEDCPIIVGVRYEYIVTATDRLGNEGEGSTVMSAVLANGQDAPVVTYAYANTGSSIRYNNEYFSTVKGKENEFTVYVSDDQEITAIEITASPENGEFFIVGSPSLYYNGSSGGSSEYRATLKVDTTAFSDGVYTFRFTATDSSGNKGSMERRYYVDNNAPAPVTGLNVTGTSNGVYVNWNWTPNATGEMPDRYRVYYSTDSDFESYDYTNVYAYEGVKNCTIRRLEPETLYYVRVTTFDVAGNESAYAEGSATTILDEEKPVITKIRPDDNRLGANIYFWIDATDNAELDWNSVRAEINAGEDGSFIPFGTYSYGTVRAENLVYNGNYTIRFYISDLSGNESDAFEITREIDSFVTNVTGLTASPAAGGIRLTWDRNPDNDLSYYYVYRSEGGDYAIKNYLSPLKITKGDTVTWIDYSTRDDITYSYKIVAVDDVNNKSSFDDTTSAESQKGNYNTSITLNPYENVKPGSIIHINAEGFRGGEYVTAYIDDNDDYILWTYADDDGNVSADWSYVKATEEGSHTIKLVGGYSSAEASADFTCNPTQLPAPSVPESAPGVMEINLSWESVDNASYYRVYRAEGTFDEELIADRIYSLSYTDRTVKMTGDVGNIYTYTVAAVDRYGIEGKRSEPTVNRPDADLNDPEIDVFTFQRTGNELHLIAEVSDDLRLSNVVFKYKPSEASDSAYITIADILVKENKKKATINSSFDTSSLADGKYTLLVQAVDGAGRVSVPMTKTMTISSEAPNAPENLTAVSEQMKVKLSWNEPTEQNVRIARYNIYRKSGDGGFTFITSTTLTSYTDLKVDNNETYLYKVTCVSEAETEGPAVTLISRVSPKADTLNPEITGFVIPGGTRVAGNISLAVSVTDNVGVDHVDFYLKSDLEEVKIGSSQTGAITVDTAEYIKEGTLSFKVIAYDANGNSSEANVSYQVDNAPPVAPSLTASESELSVTLKWTMTSIPRDFLKYNIYEYTPSDGKYRLIGETTSSVFVYNTDIGGSYCVSAVDDLGNESLYSNIEESMPGRDITAPVINNFRGNNVARSDETLTIDAKDNTNISSYIIEYRPLITDEITGAVVPKEGADAPWYALSSGSWNELTNLDAFGNVKTLEWNTLAVFGTENGPEAKFPDGLYALALTLTDGAGNKSSSEIRVSVANDPPTAPEGFRVDSGEWKLIVSWKPAPGNEATDYVLYRKVNDGDYELLAYTTSNVYVDYGLNPVNQYFYKVAMENDLGKIGPTTDDYSEGILPPGVKTRPDAETSLPVIMSMSPAQSSRFNAGLNIELQIGDNVGLSTVELWKSYIGESSAQQVSEDAIYEIVDTIDVTGLERELVNTSDTDILGTELFVVKKTIDTSAWEQGNYAIKAVVRNMGSEPSVQIKSYFKDSTPPPQPELTLSDPRVGGTINLSWTKGGADVANYRILRTDNPEATPENCVLVATPLSPAYTDTGLTDGKAYYYYIITVDNAGNESEPSKRQSMIPTAVSDLGVYSVYSTPATLASGRTNTIRASLRNNGSAAADGVVKFYYDSLEIGSTNVSLSANTSGEVYINWDTPTGLPERVDITAVVTTVQNTDATDENNSFTGSDIKVNIPPVSKIVLPELSEEGTYDSGVPLTFSASGSSDTDGSIVQYRWDFGNGKKGDYATSSVTYTMPGRYTVTLTVTDDCGAKTETSQVITVGDRRPDLFVESIRWTPTDPEEGDMVTITATIGNKGFGDATLGFLTGFYIDNRYMGYSKTDVGEDGISLAYGKTTEVSFTYQATAGTHIVKVVANDILNNLAETSKANNVKSEVLSSQQLNFADVSVTNVYWDPKGTVFDTQSPFVYRADISNIGKADASNFSVSLYIDDEFSGRQTIPVLSAGASTTLSFSAVPKIGVHKVEVKADDLNPCLIEANVENNNYSIVTDEFSVYYPELEVTEVTWKPTETTLTDGTSLLFTAKITNLSAVNITDNFRVTFTMDGKIFRTLTVEGIGGGEVKEVQAKWTSVEGDHQLGVIVDPQHTVTDPEKVVRKDIKLPRLSIIYPNVCVSNVSYSPIKVEAGKPVNFLVTITNNNVASAFKRFNVGLYVDGKAVGGASVDGIRGFSTVPVIISWKPTVGGAHNVKIVADSYGELKMDAPSEGTSRTWSSVINVSEALVMTTHPNEKDQDADFLAVLYSTSEEKITLTADLRHSSNLNVPVTPDDDGAVYYSISHNGEIAGDRSGQMRYDYATGLYKVDVPLGSDMATGTYQLDFTGTSGADSVIAPTTNIKIVRDGKVTVETNKNTYQLGESIYVSGTFRYSDGTPVANERVVLDYQLMPALKEPVQSVDANGKEVLMRYQAEEIVFVETDENGAYSSIFTPFTGEAGEWSINAFGYDKMLGTGASISVQVWGLVSTPSSLKLVATENSQFSKEITVRNPSPKNSDGAPLTGLSAALVQKSGHGVTATLDTKSMARTLSQGATTSVQMNVSATLGCSETADFEITFTTDQGAFCKTQVHLNLVPANPIPVTDQKSISVGMNPGDVTSRVVTVTNKGKGTLNGLKATVPVGIPWVSAGNIGKTTLLPNESTTFTVTFAPGESVALGQYQDTLVVSDSTGKFYANVGLSAEITAVKTGGISLRITDDVGTLVHNATVTLISKDEYISITGGVEQTYYASFSARTDENGIAQFYDKPLGAYDMVVTATGREKYVGECEIMPSTGAPFTNIVMKNLPVQIEWTVVPTTIVDEYEIKLELTFGAHIPSPSFGFNPPWVNIPKNVTEPVYVEANVVNTGLVAITDVVASIVREKESDTGISIVGGGYIGEIAAQSSARIKLLVQPGVYNLPYGTNAAGLAKNYIKLEGSYVSFDPDTGLPVDPSPIVTGALPLYNPSATPVTVQVRMPENNNEVKEETIQLPEGQMEEIRYIAPEQIDKDKELSQDGSSAYEIVKLSLNQTATLERQAFDATLKVTNGYPEYALNNLRVDVFVKDENGQDVSNKNFIIATGVSGISDVDGNGSLASGSALTATWQIIPGSDLGGTTPQGRKYYASALVSYYVNGKLVQTETEGVPITILPQPKLTLNYFVPHDVLSNTPFRLGVTVENYGFGEAMNLNINSGQLKVESNQSGLITDFEILGSSFGSSTGSEFKLAFGNVPAASRVFNEMTSEWDIVPGKVSGYWVVRWNMPLNDGDPYEGEFREFKATLTHKDYKGVQLNPLITAVNTSIIGKDGVLEEKEGEGGLALVNEGDTGFCDYLINLNTGLRIPIYVPDSVKVASEYNGNTMTVEAVGPSENTDARYQVIMIPEPEGCGNIASVKLSLNADGSNPIELSHGNFWKDYGYIYLIGEIPVVYDNELNKTYPNTYYTVEFGSSAFVSSLDYSRFVYVQAEPGDAGAIQIGKGTTGWYFKNEAFYDTGIYPDAGDNDIRLRAVIDNRGKDTLSGYLVFTATAPGSETPEFRSSDIPFENIQPYAVSDIYCTGWTPKTGEEYTIAVELHETGGKLINTLKNKAVINTLPYSHAGADIVDAVMGQPVRFDGSRSYDKDGYISTFVWDFGDGESGFGPTPTHVYQHAGTYRANLYVTDNNLSSTEPYLRDSVTDEIISSTMTDFNYFSEIQVTVNADCPDLFINNISFSNANPDAGETVTATATIQNGTLPNDGGLTSTGNDAYYLVGFYLNDRYIGFTEMKGDLSVGGTATASIGFKAETGPQKFSAVVNDIGRNIREVNYDNNRKDTVLCGNATDFADIEVSNFEVNLKSGSDIDWGSPVNVSALIKNKGSASASKFKVLLYDNDKLIQSRMIDGLTAGEGIKLEFIWKPETSGNHLITLSADGPVSAVVEMNELNNSDTIELTEINVLYPDLEITEVSTSVNGTTLAPGQNIVLYATVKNSGKGNAVVPTRTSFYANSRYIGSAEAGAIAVGESTLVSLVWKDPSVSVTSITAIADDGEVLSESSETNNSNILIFDTPVKVSAGRIEISDMITTGANKYGDSASTVITVFNSGERTIEDTFTVALYAGNNRVGTATCGPLAIGEKAKVTIDWTAQISGNCTLRAYADSESKLVLSDRSLASAIKTINITPGLIITGETDSTSYCIGDKAEINASVALSSASYLPISADNFTALISKDGGDAVPLEMVYDIAKGTYIALIELTQTGKYTVNFTAEENEITGTCNAEFNVADDFFVTINNEDSLSYSMGQSIHVSGAVRTPEGEGYSGVPVTITAVGSDTFRFTAVTTADGSYSTDIQLPDGVGGAFSLRASATYNDVLRRSDRVAFYVDGISIDVSDRMTIVQGYESDLTGYINNLGVTETSVDEITVSNLPKGLTYEVATAPKGTLSASSGSELVITFKASAELAPGEHNVTLNVGESEREVTVTCEKAVAIARVNVIGNTEAENQSLQTPNITMSLRQGETSSSVIRLTNIGTANITGVSADTDIPFIYLQNVDPKAVIMPVNRGYTIRDPNGSLSIVVNASPSDYCQTGVYEGAVTITSPSLDNPIVVPVKIAVGAGQVGTTVFEIRNQDNTLLSGAKVTLIGLDEQRDPVRYDAVTGDGDKSPLGEVLFENIPAGNYKLKVTADSHSTLETTVEVSAVIDKTPRIVTLTRQLFSFSVDENTISEMRNSSASTPNYNNVAFKAGLLADSDEPQLAPNFMADEKEFFYQSGKLLSKISFMDPKDANASIDNITVRITDADNRIPNGAIAFSGGETLSPVKKMGSLAPGEVFDVIWNLDIDRFFRIATVSETEIEGQYSVQFPSDVTREMIDAYIAANDPSASGTLSEISFDAKTNTGIYQSSGVPSDRVPIFYGNTPYSFDFTILASGERKDTNELVETKVPVRIHYIPPDYYVMAGEPDSLYDDDGNYKGQQYVDIYDVHPDIEQKVAVSPAFAPASGRVSEMRYSSGFLHDLQVNTPNVPDDNDDVSIDLGFSGDAGYEGQVTTLSMKLKNPSIQYPMKDLHLELVLTDAPYDGSGNLQPGGTVLFPNVDVYVENDNLHKDGGVVEGYLGTDEEAVIEYSFRLDNLLRDFESLSDFDETLSEYLKDTRQLNKVYARIEGSFTLNGVKHTFISAVREYDIKEQPKLYISYDIKDKGNSDYALTATITNLGSGDAFNITMGAPSIPNVGFDMRITGVTSSKGIVQRGVSAGFDRVEISVLHPGDTTVITYDLAAVSPLTDAQKLSLGKLAALPSIPIKADTGIGIVMAPMKMEAMRSQSTLEDIDSIIEELGYLANNLRVLTDKTASELGRSLADFYDYSNSLQVAIAAGESFETLARFVGVVGFIKDLYDLPGKVKSLSNHFKNYKFEATKVETLGFLDDWFDGALYELQDHLARDIDWTLDFLPKDIGYWYDSYNDAATRAETLSSKVDMGKAFGDYVRLTKAAAQLLADASTAINNALKTYSTQERADQAKIARVKMEEAAALIKDAKKLKANGNELFKGIVSGVADNDGLMLGYIEDQLRLEVAAYIAAAENALEPRITAVAAGLAQLAGLEDFENQVKILQSSSSQIDGILKEDERLANEMTGLVKVANSIFTDIGYNVNASAEERLNALRNGRKVLKEKMIALALRPAVWFSGLFKIADNSASKNVQESTPDMVRTVGKVIQKLENGGSDGSVAENILTEFFGGASSTYDWFVREFEGGYPYSGTKADKRRYIATAIVKLSTRELLNETLFNKSLETLMLSGLSDFRQSVEAARISSSGVKTNVYYTQNSMDQTILKIIELLNKYKTDPQMLTGYYPSAQLLDYVKNLNSSISAMVRYPNGNLIESGHVGRYRSLWTYSGAGLDLNVKETTLGEIYKAQQLVDTLLAEGYNNVADRYVLNYLKVMESSTSIIGTSIGLLSGSPVTAALGSMVGVAGKLLDSSGYTAAKDTLDNANLYNLSRATADLAITTNMMLSKEANFANDLYSVFDTMEKWRKVDPELPIEIVTADMKDLTVEDDTIFAQTTAALTVLNNHTGSVTVAPTVEIYDSFGMVNTVNMGTKTIAPGETGEFITDVYVPINMLRDMGGYTAVFTFAASEADTMTIAPTFGPYITHFNVGNAKTVDYLRNNAQAKQPLGGTLKAGESKSVTVNVDEGNLLYVFAAAKSGDDIQLIVAGAGTPEISSHINTNDFVLVPDASGEYTVTVVNNKDEEFEFDLLTVVSPNLGAVIGLDMPYAKVMASEYRNETVNGIKASIPVSIYETGLTEGADIGISASDLDNGMGQIILAPQITDLKGYEFSGNFHLNAGEGKSLVLSYYPDAEMPDGDYNGTVTLNVLADNFENELTPLGWKLNGDVYELTIPVSVRISTATPPVATLDAGVTEDERIAVEGKSKPDSFAVIYLAKDETSEGTVKGIITVGENGTFSTSFIPDESGSYYVYVRASDNNGALGEESERILVTTDIGDKTAPVIALISPQTDIQLGREVEELIFTVSDNESPISDTPTLAVDGIYADVTLIADGRYSATPHLGSIKEGTHTVIISAESDGGVAEKEFTIIIGESIETVISVTGEGSPISDAVVSMNGENKTTNKNGKAYFTVAPGEYQYTVSMEGYITESGLADFNATLRTENVDLKAGGVMTVVVSANGQPVTKANVNFGKWSAVSGENGIAKVTMPYGTYDYQVSAAGYKKASGNFKFTKDTDEPLNVELNVDKFSELQVRLKITDVIGKSVKGINVEFDGKTAETDSNGEVFFSKNVGTYECNISGGAYKAYAGTVSITTSDMQTIVMYADGVSYDEDSEILTLDTGYKAWTESVGGEEIIGGTVVRRELYDDKVVYIENSHGERAPFIIPTLGGIIKAVITVTSDSEPLVGATVTLDSENATTDNSGKVTFSVEPGEYEYTVSKEGYLPESGLADFEYDSRTKSVDMTAGGIMTVVVSADVLPMTQATVKCGEWSALCDENGIAEILMPYGTYDYTVSALGYSDEKGSFTFTKDTSEPLNVTLKIEYQTGFKIVNFKEKPISGISVELDGEIAETDENGEVFFIKNIGTYDYNISGVAYKAVNRTLSVESSGDKHIVVLNPAGMSYDKASQILTLETGYKAWSNATGGKQIQNGGIVKREKNDKLIYIESSLGERIPFVVPALGKIFIKDVKKVDGEKLEVTVANSDYPTTGNISLIGGLYNGNKSVSVLTSVVSNLTDGEERTVTIDFGKSIDDYTCKLFLWDKSSQSPYCRRWEVDK